MTLQIDDPSGELRMASAPTGPVHVPRRHGLYRNYIKRLFDIAAVLASSIIVLPVVLVLAMIVATDGSSPFYWNDRVGKGGRTFRMLKLRTMVPNADAMLQEYLDRNAEARLEWDSTQKLKTDPRITRIGRILRKTSIDELPQLWNVLIGDMSLVGPRPMMPNQRSLYHGLAYYALRPGVTGPWQISDRNESAFSKRAEFDSQYDATVSLGVDLRILFATVAVVFRGTGY
ncbi:MAG: sugar transferase [Rhodobacteraceae bacterium]|nr:sugar transferase [Paracoccaceae bacterium]